MPQHIVLGDGAGDTLSITFDPSGSVDGNVSPEAYDFGAVTLSGSEETLIDFTLYNNGTIAMDSTGQQNQSTDEGDMDCAGGGGPGEDEYSIRITDAAGIDGDTNYINDVGTTVLDNSLASLGSETFKLTIYLGSASSDHPQQTTQVNWTFAAA